MQGSREKFFELVTIAVPLIILLYSVGEHFGFIDRFLGNDDVMGIYERFNTSYDPSIDRKVGSDEPGWARAMTLIRKHSAAKIEFIDEKMILARSVATVSGKVDLPNGKYAEWTAPSTPLLLVNSEGEKMDGFVSEDVQIVGSIGDLKLWVEQDQLSRRFLFQDIFSPLAAAILAIILWKIEHRKPET